MLTLRRILMDYTLIREDWRGSLFLQEGAGIQFNISEVPNEGLLLEIENTGGGGGGSSDHALLTHLSWSASGHTGTANRLAGFDGTGAASYYTGHDVLDQVLTHRGDIAYRNGVSSTRLPIGAANRLLMSDGTDPAWAAPADVRAALSLVVGTNVQAWDADLDAIAALGNGLPVRSAGTWTTATISAPLSLSGSTLSVDLSGYQPLDSDLTALAALSSTGLIARTGSGTMATRTVTGGSGITVTNGDGVSGNPEIAVQEDVKGFPLYRLFTVIQPQGVVAPNVDGVGATITSTGLYGVNVSEAGFPCTQYGDASASGCRFYVLGYFRIEAGTATTDILFKMGSDIAAGITVVHIGFSSNASLQTADPTGHRYTIRWARGTDTNWQLSVKDGTTQTLVDTGVAVTADYYYAVRFVATSSLVTVQISAASTVTTAKSGIDAAGTTSASTNLPGTANDLYAIFSMQRSAASTSRCLKFGYWRTIQVMA